MATSQDFVEYVCQQISGIGMLRYRKMFGEYMVYLNDKPVIIVCDDTPYVKMLDIISDMMEGAGKGFPYNGAKEHYILDIDNSDFSKEVILKIESVTPLPKKRNKKEKYDKKH
ncbi:MAG: transcriptional regulator [Bacilli bacterium]|nr:transcriptional regulator [Bacilli bacterium]